MTKVVTKPWLCEAGKTLMWQINRTYATRDKTSDGWIGDIAHQARKSDHNPDAKCENVVRAVDIDADLEKGNKNKSWELADELRRAAKKGEKRISYIIHQGKIASPRLLWKWRNYSGGNPHHHHIHISFTKAGDHDPIVFKIASL